MPRNAIAYDEDFFAWTEEQARLLRAGELAEIDALNLAEEVESMGRRDRQELESRLTVLLAHLLKWQVQPERRSTSWSGTIREQRRQIARKLRDSPSLRPVLEEVLAEVYADAREDAAEETGISEADFPADFPFTVAEILSRSFLPD
jgi:ribosomal protein L29